MFKIIIIVVTLLSILPSLATSDSWALPNPKWYFSNDSLFCFEVIPSSYEYNIIRPENLSFNTHAIEIQRDKANGKLFKRDHNYIYQLVFNIELVNSNSPLNALVSDSGEYIVTFNNWHSVGYGDDVIVIYDKNGKLIKQLSLEKILTEEKIKTIGCTSSSRWWGYYDYLDETTKELVLKIVSNEFISLFNEWAIFDDEIRIDLKTGFVTKDYSFFDEIVNSYSDTCYDSYWCPTIRYLYFKIKNPDSSVIEKYSTISFSENNYENLEMIYDAFSESPSIEIASAYHLYGREVFLFDGRSNYIYFLLEGGPELKSDSLRDMFPFILKLPDGRETYPLKSYKETFNEALYFATDHFFDLSYQMMDDTTDSTDIWDWSQPSSRVHTNIYLVDTTIEVVSKLVITEFCPGIHIYMDLSFNIKN